MRTGLRLPWVPDAAASAARTSHQFPLELSPPLTGADVVGHAERAVVDRFLATLHGGDGRRHQQMCKLADGAFAPGEQVAVPACNRKRPCSQSAQFPAQINCD